VSSIARVFRILEMLVDAPEGVRVTDIANEMSLNRAIPHRLLAELVELGYVAQDPATERYRATFLVGSLGLRQLETAGVPRWAQDELTALAERSRELVRLAVATDKTLRFIAEAQGAHSQLIIYSPMRGDIAVHATASGKAWLSSMPDGEVRSVLESRLLERFTPQTKTDIDEILAEVARARSDGFAITVGEMEAGINAVAAPVRPSGLSRRRAVGTVSIAGPSVRLPIEALTGFGPVVRETVDKLATQWHVYEYLDALTDPEAVPAGA
jgi:DNA-binding IclR family transcriptional regulator